jgi:hypothetical protein
VLVRDRMGNREPVDTTPAVPRPLAADRGAAGSLAVLADRGAERPVPPAALAALGIYSATTIWTVTTYHNEIRHFNKHIREHCPAELRRNVVKSE